MSRISQLPVCGNCEHFKSRSSIHCTRHSYRRILASHIAGCEDHKPREVLKSWDEPSVPADNHIIGANKKVRHFIYKLVEIYPDQSARIAGLAVAMKARRTCGECVHAFGSFCGWRDPDDLSICRLSSGPTNKINCVHWCSTRSQLDRIAGLGAAMTTLPRQRKTYPKPTPCTKEGDCAYRQASKGHCDPGCEEYEIV